MSTKNILSNEERLELIKKYEDDKLNSPPSNILDSTLIKNYGSDEQKARLQPAPAAQEQKGTEDEKPTTESINPTAQEISNAIKDGTANFKSKDEPADLVKEKPNVDTSGETPTYQVNLGVNNSNMADYVKEYSRYTEVFKTMPPQDLTADQLRAASDEQEKALKSKKLQAEQNKKTLAAKKSASVQKLTLRNDKGEEIRVTQIAYENYIKKQMPEWSLVLEAPEEAKGLNK